MNVTIDDSHPQIDYHGNWSIWRPPNMDSGTPLYFRGTFTSVWNPDHWMNFTFNGTSASVYGTKWLNHGAYSVSVDGGEEETFEGYTPDRRYNQLIYQTGPLDMGQHELRMYNRPNSTTILEPDPTKNDGRLWLDVDYIVVGLPIPAGANVTTTVIDDSHPSITYSREWSPRPNSDSGYYNVTAHQTNTANSGFTMPFTGSSVQLFGTIGPDVGNFSCTVDGVPYVRELNGTWYEKRTNSPLFFLSGLEDGPHTLNLVNLGRGPDKSTFEFDYAVVNSTAPRQQGSDTAPDGSVDNPTGVAGRPSGGSGSALGSGTGSSRTNVGAIAGGVIGGLAAIALLVLLFLCWRRRKRDSTSGDNASASSIEKSPHSPVQQVRVGSRAPGLSGNEVRPFVSDLATSPTLSSSFGTGTATGMAGAGSSVRTGNASTLTYPTEKRGFDRGPGTGAGPSDTSSSAYSPVSDTHHPFQAFHGYRPTPPQPRLSTIADSAHLQLGEPLGRHNTGSTGYLSTNTAEHLGTGSEMDQAHDSDGVQAGEEGSGSGRRSDGQGSSSAGNTNYHTAHSDVQSVQGAPPPDYYTAAASGGSRMQGPVVPRR